MPTAKSPPDLGGRRCIRRGLGQNQNRLPGCILTAPDPKHSENIIKALGLKPGEKSPVPSRKPDLNDTTPLEAGDAARYSSAVGSGIFTSPPTDVTFSTRSTSSLGTWLRRGAAT